jgi:four helix bundle protein
VSEVRSHRDLIVWQKSIDFAVQIYELVKTFPGDERFGMASQLTRAAVSVSANIAEGNARGSTREYAHFIGIAKGSLMEAETYLVLAVRLGFVPQSAAHPLLESVTEISKMLTALRSRLLQ